MEILPGIEMVDLALHLKKSKVLIISDMHIGFEESLNRQGVLVPRLPFAHVLEKVQKIIDRTKPEIVVLNGDTKDAFGRIGTQEWRNVKKLIDLVQKHSKLILVKGNHDTVLEPIAKDRQVKIVKQFTTDEAVIMHGDKMPEKLPKVLILGHHHPAIKIREKAKSETFKCFLKCKTERGHIILQPSFNPLSQGGDIRNNLPVFITPSKTDVFVAEDRVYEFGKLRQLP